MDKSFDITLPEYAQVAIDLLEDSGFEAWCVGGFVRDALLGRTAGDVDIATDALWPDVQRLFEDHGYHSFETGVKHGTLSVLVDGQILEITTYRSEGSYSDARHPDSVAFVRDIREDLARRDFTINAMAYHPARGLFDPFSGRSDLAAHLIRTVGDPPTRFSEDALRVLRACRFSSQLGFSIDAETKAAMEANAGLLQLIAAERIAHEMEGFICGVAVHDALLECLPVLLQVIPELGPMAGLDQKTPYHIYDVLEHTAYVMQFTPPYPLVRWSALFHDMGKPEAFFTDAAGVGHFYGHAKISVELARAVMKRLKIKRSLTDDVLVLVRRHDDIVAPTPKAVKRMLGRLGGRVDLFRALTDLKRGDARAQAPRCLPRVQLADELDGILDGILQAQEAFSLKDLAIDGADVIALGVAPGPRIGELLREALDGVIDERIPNERAALLRFVEAALKK